MKKESKYTYNEETGKTERTERVREGYVTFEVTFNLSQDLTEYPMQYDDILNDLQQQVQGASNQITSEYNQSSELINENYEIESTVRIKDHMLYNRKTTTEN